MKYRNAAKLETLNAYNFNVREEGTQAQILVLKIFKS